MGKKLSKHPGCIGKHNKNAIFKAQEYTMCLHLVWRHWKQLQKVIHLPNGLPLWQESCRPALPAQSLSLQPRGFREGSSAGSASRLLPPRLRDDASQTALLLTWTSIQQHGRLHKSRDFQATLQSLRKICLFYWVGLFSFTWTKFNQFLFHIVLKSIPSLSPKQLL